MTRGGVIERRLRCDAVAEPPLAQRGARGLALAHAHGDAVSSGLAAAHGASAGIGVVVRFADDVAKLVQPRELLVVRPVRSAVAQPELLAVAGDADAEPCERGGGAVDREQRDPLREVVKLADGFVVEVELLAPDVEEPVKQTGSGRNRNRTAVPVFSSRTRWTRTRGSSAFLENPLDPNPRFQRFSREPVGSEPAVPR